VRAAVVRAVVVRAVVRAVVMTVMVMTVMVMMAVVVTAMSDGDDGGSLVAVTPVPLLGMERVSNSLWWLFTSSLGNGRGDMEKGISLVSRETVEVEEGMPVLLCYV
jgi:hypothetical protein